MLGNYEYRKFWAVVLSKLHSEIVVTYSGSSLRNHNAEVADSNPLRFTLRTLLMRKTVGNQLMKIHFLEAIPSSASSFRYARNQAPGVMENSGAAFIGI